MRDQEDGKTSEIPMPGGGGSLIGYARVSTPEQDLAPQIAALKKAGCHRIFEDVASGAKDRREGLDAALAYIRPNDTLVVWKIDRLGRSLAHLVALVDELSRRGVGFRSLTNAEIDTTTSSGRLFFNIMAMLADFERTLIRERTKAALEARKAKGITGGRRRSVSAPMLAKARRFIDEHGMTVREAAGVLKIGKSTLYRALADDDAQGDEG